MGPTPRSTTVRYLFAVSVAIAAIVIRAGLDPLWGSALPLITFFPAIMASAWLGGFGPGLTTTLLTALSASYLWLPLGVHGVAAFVGLTVFLSIGVLISTLTETLHRSERRQAAALAGERATRVEIERGREAMASLAAIVHDTDDAIVSKTLDGVITSWNPAAERLFGYPAADAIGQPITLIVPPERLEEERDILARLQAGENLHHFETERVGYDRRRIPVSLTISRVTDSAGRVVGVSNIARDITERKEAEAASRELDRHKDQFLAIVSHEMRNPLGAIMAAASVLATNPAVAAAAPRPLDIIRRQTEHLARLVDDLLDVARLTTGKVALQKTRLDLAEVTHACVTAMIPGEASGSSRVELTLAPAWIDGDADRVQQIVANLVRNALKFTPGNGAIQIQVQRLDHEAVLRVKDSGIGITAELLPHVFELFMQGESARTRREGGLGIGLTIVRRLVDLHGARIEAHSDGPGRGAEFVVRFPAIG